MATSLDETAAKEAPPAPPCEDDWSELDPMIRFAVRLGAVLFIGVVCLALFLVPYALISNGWTPGQ